MCRVQRDDRIKTSAPQIPNQCHCYFWAASSVWIPANVPVVPWTTTQVFSSQLLLKPPVWAAPGHPLVHETSEKLKTDELCCPALKTRKTDSYRIRQVVFCKLPSGQDGDLSPNSDLTNFYFYITTFVNCNTFPTPHRELSNLWSHKKC